MARATGEEQFTSGYEATMANTDMNMSHAERKFHSSSITARSEDEISEEMKNILFPKNSRKMKRILQRAQLGVPFGPTVIYVILCTTTCSLYGSPTMWSVLNLFSLPLSYAANE